MQSLDLLCVLLRDGQDVKLLHVFLARISDLGLLSCKFVREDLLVDWLRVEFRLAIFRIDEQVADFHLRCILGHSEHRDIALLLVPSIEILKFAIWFKFAFFAFHEVLSFDQF